MSQVVGVLLLSVIAKHFLLKLSYDNSLITSEPARVLVCSVVF